MTAVEIKSREQDFCAGPGFRHAYERFLFYWLPLSEESETFLSPPIDVHWVLFCKLVSNTNDMNDLDHQPQYLPRISKNKCGNELKVHYYDKSSKQLWHENYPRESFEIADHEHLDYKINEDDLLQLQKVSLAQHDFARQVCFPHFKSVQYLYCSYIRLLLFYS